VLLPFVHDFDDRDRDPLKLLSSRRSVDAALKLYAVLTTFLEGRLYFGMAAIKALRGGAVPATTFQRYAFAPGLSHDGFQLMLKSDFGGKRHFLDACALQMGRKRSAEQKRVLAEALEKKRRTVPEASSAAAPVDSGTDPPPAGRFRRSCRTPTAQVPSGRPLRLPPLLRTARWRLVEVMPQ
jgi:hypothetical protein